MGFALQLRDSLQLRESQVPVEFANGDSLGVVLTRDLLAVEAAADTDMLTSILLLDGRQLRHGAAPNRPPAYCAAIDGADIGPKAGSCGTAAFSGRSVYVTDIANDPIWADYRDLALAHGLRACWSTPIFDDQGAVIGTFAIYHLTPRAPISDEIEAIQTITDHVARAIMWSNRPQDMSGYDAGNVSLPGPGLKLVTDDYERSSPGREQDNPGELLLNIASDFEALGRVIELAIDRLAANEPHGVELTSLRRARDATLKGAACARRVLGPNGKVH